MKIIGKITTRFRATHQWKQCDIEEVMFLKNEHHHEFRVEVLIEQRHGDRDVEYIAFQRYLDRIIQQMLEDLDSNRSCEHMASYLNDKISGDYKNRWASVEVTEDGYYGAVVTNE